MDLKQKKKNIRNGLLFCSPALIGLSLLIIYPAGSSFYYSLTSYNITQAPRFSGLTNYSILFRDPLFWKSLYNTMYYTLLYIPLTVIIGISVAMLLNTKVKGQSIYRSIFYLPSVLPEVAIAFIFLWMLRTEHGIVNDLLSIIGIKGPGWLSDPSWAKLSIVLVGIYMIGSTMVVYLAALQDIPLQLIEASLIDGANWFQRIWHITIPMLTPAILFTVVMSLIKCMQLFTSAYVMTDGKPMNSTLFYSLYLFRNAFSYWKMGYAAAMGWILLIISLGISLLILRTSKHWVYYAAEGNR